MTVDKLHERIAVFGGVYSNHVALEAVLADARGADVEAIYCLGDVGAFGPFPDKSVEILRRSGALIMQGNYDASVGNRLHDCQCGYTDPRDNHYAQLSYDYTLANTNDSNRDWLRDLPTHFRVQIGETRVYMAHGSPRRMNEFLWESTTPDAFIARLLRGCDSDFILCTHTGLHWSRFLPAEPGRGIVNVGAIGRPANDGDTAIWYALVTAGQRGDEPIDVEFRRVEYDYGTLANEMREEELPQEFIETILTGWWTTCLEILPSRERALSRY